MSKTVNLLISGLLAVSCDSIPKTALEDVSADPLRETYQHDSSCNCSCSDAGYIDSEDVSSIMTSESDVGYDGHGVSEEVRNDILETSGGLADLVCSRVSYSINRPFGNEEVFIIHQRDPDGVIVDTNRIYPPYSIGGIVRADDKGSCYLTVQIPQTFPLPANFCSCYIQGNDLGSQPCPVSRIHPGELQCGYGINDI